MWYFESDNVSALARWYVDFFEEPDPLVVLGIFETPWDQMDLWDDYQRWLSTK